MKRRTGIKIILIAIIVSLVSINAAWAKPSIKLTNLEVQKTPKGFLIKGQITAYNVNRPIPEKEVVDVNAEVSTSLNSRYPVLADYLNIARGCNMRGGRCISKKEEKGEHVDVLSIASFLLRPSPVWRVYGGLKEWKSKAPNVVTKKFHGYIPLKYAGKRVRIHVMLTQVLGGPNSFWPATSYYHDIKEITLPVIETSVKREGASSEKIDNFPEKKDDHHKREAESCVDRCWRKYHCDRENNCRGHYLHAICVSSCKINIIKRRGETRQGKSSEGPNFGVKACVNDKGESIRDCDKPYSGESEKSGRKPPRRGRASGCRVVGTKNGVPMLQCKTIQEDEKTGVAQGRPEAGENDKGNKEKGRVVRKLSLSILSKYYKFWFRDFNFHKDPWYKYLRITGKTIWRDNEGREHVAARVPVSVSAYDGSGKLIKSFEIYSGDNGKFSIRVFMNPKAKVQEKSIYVPISLAAVEEYEKLMLSSAVSRRYHVVLFLDYDPYFQETRRVIVDGGFITEKTLVVEGKLFWSDGGKRRPARGVYMRLSVWQGDKLVSGESVRSDANGRYRIVATANPKGKGRKIVHLDLRLQLRPGKRPPEPRTFDTAKTEGGETSEQEEWNRKMKNWRSNLRTNPRYQKIINRVTELYAKYKDWEDRTSGGKGTSNYEEWKKNHEEGRDYANALKFISELAKEGIIKAIPGVGTALDWLDKGDKVRDLARKKGSKTVKKEGWGEHHARIFRNWKAMNDIAIKEVK